MIQYLKRIQKGDPETYKRLDRSLRDHVNFNTVSRFTFGELDTVAQHVREHEYEHTQLEMDQLHAKFNDEEWLAIERLINQPKRRAEIQERVKLATQRCTRICDALLERFEEQDRLDSLIAERKSKLAVGHASTDYEASIKRLRAVFGDGY